jgi:hypothetical protein
MSARSTCALALLLALSWTPAAFAGPGYASSSFSVKGSDSAKLVAAFEKLNASAVMKARKSRAYLLAHVADGTDPSSHTITVVNPSLAASEAFRDKLLSDPAWAEWTAALYSVATPTASARYQTLRSWGDLSDGDVIWESYTCNVSDLGAFIAAHDRFFASETGKRGGAQVHLVAVAAAGGAPFTHGIDVGWASEAEMEAWRDANADNPDWLAYLAAANAAGSCANPTLSRVVSASGVSLKAALGK